MGGAARSGWTWRRALTLALCLLVLAFTVRPHPVEASLVGAGIEVTASADASGPPPDPDGGPAQHCSHCGCTFVGLECSEAPRVAPRRIASRFTTGAQAGPDASFLIETPPPRS